MTNGWKRSNGDCFVFQFVCNVVIDVFGELKRKWNLEACVFLFQVYIFGDLHSGNDNQKHSKGLHPQQVYVSAESMELAGFRGHHQRLRHNWDGSGQSGGFADVSGVKGAKNCFYHAR